MGSSSSFLLVDDDPIFLAVAESALETLGYDSVTTAGNGAQGLQALAKTRDAFEHIILDLNMPGLDGLAFLRAAASLGFKGRVIISSGEAEAVLKSARLMGEMLGVTVLGAIRKPLTVPALKSLLALKPEPVRNITVAPSRFTPACSLQALDILPYYQAQHDVHGLSITGVEALMRARAPGGEVHGPGKVFGLIHDQDELAETTLIFTRKVLADLKRWSALGAACRVSINLDAKVAEAPDTGAALLDLLREYDVKPELICLELTETALPTDLSRLMEALARLRMSGFVLSLDDYGTGSSNFEILRLCPFNELKIDGSVIRSAASEPISLSFAQGAVSMARQLGLEVVAEGVETEDQFRLARACGVDTVQGFLLSMPCPAEEMGSMLRTRSMRRQ